MSQQTIYAIATMDTKGAEIAFVAERIRETGAIVRVVDVGTRTPATVDPDVFRETVAGFHPDGAGAALGLDDRGKAVGAMGLALEAYLLAELEKGLVGGVIGIGGSGGTALIAQALRALPVGLPKLLVSTVASGNTQPYVDCSDITMMYSVVDVAGINRVSHRVLSNAAYAISGMVAHEPPAFSGKPALGLTMFGVTTPCVTAVREALEKQGYDCLVFHATGTGGRAMEKLVASGMIEGVLDITTTEVADFVVGGVFAANSTRFDAMLEAKVPFVVSVGALDMVNFGAKETVPDEFKERNLYVHNPQVTLMRTTPEENRKFAQFLGEKLNRSQAPVILLLPEGGVSMIDAEGQPFHGPEADAALFEELEKVVEQTDDRQIRRVPANINDDAFVEALLAAFAEVRNAT